MRRKFQYALLSTLAAFIILPTANVNATEKAATGSSIVIVEESNEMQTDDTLTTSDTEKKTANNNEAFSSLLDSAMNMLKETNQYQVNAQQAALNYALGYTDDTATLMAAQAKAMTSLQYTVAVKNKFLEAYKEIMSIQL